MAERRPLVLLDDNLIGEIPAGDMLPSSIIPGGGGGGGGSGVFDGGSSVPHAAGTPVIDFGRSA